jgi:hypothetical protein
MKDEVKAGDRTRRLPAFFSSFILHPYFSRLPKLPGFAPHRNRDFRQCR